MSNVKAWGATAWGPTIQSHRCELIGVWYYTIPNTDHVSCYQVDINERGQVWMRETFANGSASSGFLEKQGAWYQGDIGHGILRLRLEGQHVLSNFKSLQSEVWGPDVRAHRCGVLGTWRYAVPDSDTIATLLIDADECGHVRISETALSCGTSACILEKHNHWHLGNLKHKEIRVRRDGQHLLLHFRMQGVTEWGPMLRAHRLALPVADGVICVCD